MTERHLHSDQPTQPEIANTISDIDNQIEEVKKTVQIDSGTTFIGLAGSVTTMAAMALGLSEYDADAIHGSIVSVEQVDSVTEELLQMTHKQRADLGFMHPGRVDIIGGGALVLRESMRILNFDQVLVSEKDLLDGIILSLQKQSVL